MTSPAAIPIREVGRTIELALRVEDPEVVSELQKRAEPGERNAFALTALRIGVLALRTAGGQLDAGAVREAGAKLLGDLKAILSEKAAEMSGELGRSLQAYFDPRTGSLPQRLDALVRKDGDLERILAENVGPHGSVLAEALARSIGAQSPIFRMLSPDDANGLRAQLAGTLEKALEEQRAAVVRQFSLDDKSSALSRLVAQVREMQGGLQADVREQVDKVVKEFSLDKEDSALSRLVGEVEAAQKAIADQFSMDNGGSALMRITTLLDQTSKQINKNLTLDDEGSALSRLRRELMKNLEDISKRNTDFQGELRSTLAAMKAGHEADMRGTVHGLEFEDSLGAWLAAEAQRVGDLHEATGASTGVIPHCKIGDHVVRLGSDCAAAGTRIVWEAKQVGGYTFAKAVDEIYEARRNRDAQVGVFVFSRRTAPDGLEEFRRNGQDLFVVWDSENPSTDLVLKLAYSFARALVVRETAGEEAHEVGSAIEKALRAAEKKLEKLAQIATWASTVETNGKKIRETVDDVKGELEERIADIDRQVESLKRAGD